MPYYTHLMNLEGKPFWSGQLTSAEARSTDDLALGLVTQLGRSNMELLAHQPHPDGTGNVRFVFAFGPLTGLGYVSKSDEPVELKGILATRTYQEVMRQGVLHKRDRD